MNEPMRKYFYLVLILFACSALSFFMQEYRVKEDRFVIYESTPASGNLRMYWRDSVGQTYGSIRSLNASLASKGKVLVFAMNGGMYDTNRNPQGLYVEDGIEKQQMDREEAGYGNFYLQPNGIFYLTTNGKAHVIPTAEFKMDTTIAYATQSGPMLLIDGSYHKKLTKGSTNLHIRNGVGVLPNGNVLFAMSKEKTNFYDLATLFKQRGCKNALYLDGFVSRTYLPSSEWVQLDGGFGVIIGEVK
jgi:uncharacterized protein YigE (DUF2233 family)